jgi:FkbM family methyltransferase
MLVTSGETVSAEILRYGYFEEGLSHMLLTLLEPGMLFLDVGAHYGYHSLLAARMVGGGGRVIAFEPMPRTADLLRANTSKLATIDVIEQAVFSEPGTLEIVDPGFTWSAFASYTQPRAGPSFADRSVRAIVAPAISIDSIMEQLPRYPTFVKIDVESAEMHVIQGMRAFIDERRPTVSLEVGDYGVPGVAPSRDVVDTMLGFGYQAFEFGSAEVPLLPHTPRERYDYDNLVFIPRGSGSNGLEHMS